MPSPKTIELNMMRQLLRKDSVKVVSNETGLNRAGRRKMDKLARSLSQSQVEALVKLAKAKGILNEEGLTNEK